MGTPTHSDDLQIVMPALDLLARSYSGRVSVTLIGVVPERPTHPWCNHIPAPLNLSYPEFVRWLLDQGPFDVGIAPLVDHSFNRCKSPIKFLDYTGLGLTTVASDLEPYRDVIEHHSTGLLVRNNTDDWFEALEFCLLYPEQRERMALQARSSFPVDRGQEMIHARRNLLDALLSTPSPPLGPIPRACQDRWSGETVVSLPREVVAEAFLQGRGIEIGALQLPLPVPSDVEVRYVDRMDKEALYAQYPELRPHPLVDVDIIDDGERLSTFDGESEDFVIANHFLEHTEDPIGALENFLRVLRPGGYAFIAVPDKRFTFDQDRERTPLKHLLDDHCDRGENSRLLHLREWVTLVETRLGRRYDTEPLIQARINELLSCNYIHYHVWISDDVLDMLRHCQLIFEMPFDVVFFARRDKETITVLRKTMTPPS